MAPDEVPVVAVTEAGAPGTVAGGATTPEDVADGDPVPIALMAETRNW